MESGNPETGRWIIDRTRSGISGGQKLIGPMAQPRMVYGPSSALRAGEEHIDACGNSKTISNVMVVVAVSVRVLQATGLWGLLGSYRLAR